MHDEKGIGELRKESRAKWLSTFSSIMINRAISNLDVSACAGAISVLDGTIMYYTYVCIRTGKPFFFLRITVMEPHTTIVSRLLKGPLERELEREKTARL